MNPFDDIQYRPRGRFRSNHTGAHPSSEVGGFGVFRDQAPFLRLPDARRIDLRATIRDPFGNTHVRRFEQRASIDLYAILDLSGSMGFVGSVDRYAVACRLCASLAFSATRIGDRFGLIGAGEAAGAARIFPATRSRRAALDAVAHIQRIRPDGCGARGLTAIAPLLGATRKLVLLISDFRWPESEISDAFESLVLHDVAPVVLVDMVELDPPWWGLLELVDSETFKRSLIFMRPALRRRWIEREDRRRRKLAQLAASMARAPIVIQDSLDAAALSQQLMAA
jgi:uncharacterized protein (DUF58 family)